MPIFHMQERRRGQWRSITWGDFTNYKAAAEAAVPLILELKLDPADFRIKPADEFPSDSIESCECGGHVIFDHTLSAFRCDMCRAEFVLMDEPEEQPVRVKHKWRYAFFYFLSRFFANLARNCLEE